MDVVDEDALFDIERFNRRYQIHKIDDAKEYQMCNRFVLNALNHVDQIGTVDVQRDQIFHIKLIQFRPQTLNLLDLITALQVVLERIAEHLELLIGSMNHFFVHSFVHIVRVILDIFLLVLLLAFKWNFKGLQITIGVIVTLIVIQR